MAKGNLKVVLDGRGPLTLGQSHYVATGGEGAIYRANETIIKVYTDPDKMVRDGMADKVKSLARLKHPSIIAPQGLVLDEQRKPLGFYMPYGDGKPMPRVFTGTFRNETGFGDKEALTLVDRMRDTVAYAHSAKALMIDANEFNWLVKYPNAKDGPLPLVIDVDSWQIDRWPATAIMTSIRDFHAKSFSPQTDWFSWGVVTFQVFTGIHPYKGMLPGYNPGEWERRMKENLSVFTPGVRIPQAVRDFSCIPGPLLDWYQATFQQGTRTLPPSPFQTGQVAKAAQVLRAVVTASSTLVYEKLFSRAGDPVTRTWPSGAALLASGELVDMSTGLRIGSLTSPDAEVVNTPDGWLLADWQNGKPVLTFTDGQKTLPVDFTLNISRFFRVGERLFGVMERELVELKLSASSHKALVTTNNNQRWSISPNATKWFDGVAVVDMLGATFLYLPLLEGGMAQIRVKELDGLRLVDAKAGKRFVAITAADRKGDYHKLELTLDHDSKAYTLWQSGTDNPDLNMAMRPNGVVATVAEDGVLTVFVPINANGKVNKVQDRGITTAMKLTNWGDKIVYLQNGAVWQVRMK